MISRIFERRNSDVNTFLVFSEIKLCEIVIGFLHTKSPDKQSLQEVFRLFAKYCEQYPSSI